MPTGPQIILTLKILVATVTVLLLASLVALVLKRPRLHGQINTVFFVLTLTTVIGFEVLLQFVDVTAAFNPEAREALRTHLYFSIPSALLLPVMLFTGKTRRKSVHIAFGVLFAIVWAGTFVTGVFFLPHQ
ncbi:MAG: hypothetical protein U0792_02050 [Gemmataceae bacterium]